jgi:hypothetical protein
LPDANDFVGESVQQIPVPALPYRGVGRPLSPTAIMNAVAASLESLRLMRCRPFRQCDIDPAAAAALWVRAENSKLSTDYVTTLIRLNEWTMVPKKIMPYADFMHRIGILPVKPANWQEVFFPDTHNLAGS